MLVKFVKYDDLGFDYSEEITECKNVKIGFKNDSDFRYVIFDGNNKAYEVDKKNTAIYVMNDEGKTTDSWAWSEKF